jgi:2-polyprenyl-3-methyl-5-hydroxy-6-metoxy-1,4-benzoquinol methylase
MNYDEEWKSVRLGIGLCNNQDKMNSAFFWNFQAMVKPTNWIAIRGDSTIKSCSLNHILREAWNFQVQKVLFLDIDTDFPFDTIPRLLSRNKPIVSGLYHLKKHPFSPVAGWKKGDEFVNHEGKEWKKNGSIFPDNKDHLVEVDWTGIGCLLVDMEVFNNIKFHCFWDEMDEVLGNRSKGHDVIFCENAKKAGYTVHVDTMVQCDHLAPQFPVNDIFVKAYHEQKMRDREIEILSERAQTQDYWDERHYRDKINHIERTYSTEWTYILSMMEENTSVAEIGCGPGVLMKWMKEINNQDPTGYDLSEIAIENVKKLGYKGEVVDFKTWKPNGEAYDYVVSTHVLEHMEDDLGFLRKCAKMLKNGNGKVIVSVPEKDSAMVSQIEHVRLYNEETLRAVMEKVFEKVEINPVQKAPDQKFFKPSNCFVAIGSKPYGI